MKMGCPGSECLGAEMTDGNLPFVVVLAAAERVPMRAARLKRAQRRRRAGGEG